MTSDDVLFVLNDLEPVDLSDLVFCVITHGYTEAPGQGPMAGKIVQLGEERFWPFQKAEIVVLDGGGREPFGEGRKPSKWSVRDERFSTLAEALTCRDAVLAGTWTRQP